MESNFLEALRRVRWDVAFRTYGNCHATLIGLLVDWWINSDPERRWALESGPSFGYHRNNLGGGACDAILGEADESRGVVEVEGTRYPATIEKVGNFFDSELVDLKSLEFAIFLAYAYAATGRGDQRAVPKLPLDQFAQWATPISRKHPEKSFVILALDKVLDRSVKAPHPRARNEYYRLTPLMVAGITLKGGVKIEQGVFFSA